MTSGTTGEASSGLRIFVGGTSDLAYKGPLQDTEYVAEGFLASFVLEDGASAVIDWSIQVGGGRDDSLIDIAPRPDGSVVVLGNSRSPNLPTTDGVVYPNSDLYAHGATDVWVAHYDTSGNVVAMTYGAGVPQQYASSVSVDADGYVYIAGTSVYGNFPTTPNAYQTTQNPDDFFVGKLEPDLSSYVWATLLGGPEQEGPAGGLVVDEAGDVYVQGSTPSSVFPTTPGAFAPQVSDGPVPGESVVVKLSADGSDMVWGTYLGGGWADHGSRGIALADNGDVIVCGSTTSGDFPIVGGVQSTIAGENDPVLGLGWPHEAFVARLSPDGSALLASTFFGGSSNDHCTDVGIDDDGNVIVAMSVTSADFPTTAPIQAESSGTDIGLVKLSGMLDTVLFSTYLGGNGQDAPSRLALDGDRILLTGATQSGDFPVTPDAPKASIDGLWDAFLVVMTSDGQAIEFATYVGFEIDGMPALDSGQGLAVTPL